MSKARKLTPQQMKDWEAFCDDIDGNAVPVDPQDINIARQVDEMIKMFGFDEGAAHAEFRSDCAFHDGDKDDWMEVARVVRERKASGGLR